MRATIAILLLTIYALAVVRPMIPLVDYYLRLDHYKEICVNKNVTFKKCHGQCHLHTNLAEANEEKSSSVPVSVKLTADDFFVAVLTQSIAWNSNFVFVKLDFSFHQSVFGGRTAHSDIFHPPCKVDTFAFVFS